MNALPECYDSFAVTNGKSSRVSVQPTEQAGAKRAVRPTAEMVEPAERHRVGACVSRLVQVWSAGEDILLRDARRLRDSLVGRRPLPDTTRRAVALSDIDSVRTQATDPGKMLIVGTGVAIAVVFAVTSQFGK